MPNYLRRCSVRLFESCTESLELAFVSLGMPSRGDVREPSSRYAAAIGLVGVAAEQAMSAILVHVYGERFLVLSGSRFKSASDILTDIRTLLKAPPPRAAFLTSGISSGAQHLQELLRMTSQFPMLMTERAAGLHAGRGQSRDVAFIAAVRLRDFLVKLAESQRIRPYLDRLPNPPETAKEPSVLVDELAAKLEVAEDQAERSALIRSLFLVLPDLGEAPPEWIDAFERVSVVPTDDDISLLLTVLEKSDPVRLQRASAKGRGLHVVVRPDDPSAAPVAPYMLRRSLSEIADQWHADAALANGRLEAGSLDLPPADFVYDLFTLGPTRIREHLGNGPVTAQEVWPFVAAATIIRGKSTAAPYWFLVRMTEDLGQLTSLLKKAFKLANGKSVESRKAEVLEGISALMKGKSLPRESSLVTEVRTALKQVDLRREGLATAASRSKGTVRAIADEGDVLLQRIASGSNAVGDVFEAILSHVSATEGRSYWARTLAEAASDTEDRHSLAAILASDEFQGASTAAKKALRLIDAIDNGPQMGPVEA